MADTGADAAHRYREHMRAKAERLGGGEDATGVDASDFTPAEKLYAGVKTGMRPVSRQARKSGGAVMGAHARATPGRAGRKVGGDCGDSYVNRDQKAANAEREGEYPNGGMKKGGRARRQDGGGMFGSGDPAPSGTPAGEPSQQDQDKIKPTPRNYNTGFRAHGGRAERKFGGYLPREGGPSETRALRAKSASGATQRNGRPAAEDGRLGRAYGGRAGKQAGGPLATPLAAGMGGQGRMNFNFGPQASEGAKLGIKTGGSVHLKDGGRAKAHERYGHGPSCSCPECKGKREGRAYGGDVHGRSPENVEFQKSMDETVGRNPWDKSGWRESDADQRRPPAPNLPKRKAEGGEVAKGALRQHKLEHKAMGKAKGGSTYGTSTPLRLVSTHGEGERTAKVYKDPDWGEFRVRHYLNGVHQPEADAHTDDKADAVGTANAWTRGGAKSGGFRTASGNVSAAGRAKAEAKGETMKGGSFPIRNKEDLANAKQSVGRAKNPEAARRWIDKRAKELGAAPIGKADGGPTTPPPQGGRYNREAVQSAINRDPRIKGREAKMIHAVLKGRQREDFKDGGQSKARARGGKAGKGKTNINIVIGTPGGLSPPGGPQGPNPQLALKPPTPPPMPVPMPPPGGAAPGAPMPMPIPIQGAAGPPGPPGMPPPGMPPRARGGRAPRVRGEPEAGGGSGLGRLQKAAEYGHRSREGEGLRK